MVNDNRMPLAYVKGQEIEESERIRRLNSAENKTRVVTAEIVERIEYNTMEILFKELKDDMRERERRIEQRHQEQQELLLNRIDKKLDDSLSGIKSEISGIKQDVEDVKTSTLRWGIGLVVTITVALIGALPLIINTIVDLVKVIPNP